MDDVFVTAASQVTEPDLPPRAPGGRHSRVDLLSRLALLAVDSLNLNFEAMPRDRIGICLASRAGSLSTDADYWKGRALAGGPSPTLFAYTLPSAAIGEIAIRHQLRGPNLCFVGEDANVLSEAAEMIAGGEADGCVCVSCNILSAAAAELIQAPPAASACGLFLKVGSSGLCQLRDIDRDMEKLCARVCALKSAA